MPSSRRIAFAAAAIWTSLVGSTLADQQYCSPINTGSNLSPETDIYNSNGACTKYCGTVYAFAIVQYQNCWCSNYAPAVTVDISNCQEPCPGYPAEKCGNESSQNYGYIALGPAAQGTARAAVVLSTSSAVALPPNIGTIFLTATQPASTEVSYVTLTPSSTSTSTSLSSSTSDTVVASPSQVTSTLIYTVSGAIVTQTVTSTPTASLVPNSSPALSASSSNNNLSSGALAGIIIGALLGAALLIVAAIFLWRRRTSADDPARPGSNSNSASRRLGRNVSVLSKAGLLARGGRPSMTETDHHEHGGGGAAPGVFVTSANGHTHSVRHSLFGANDPAYAGMVQPESPLDDSSRAGSSHARQGSRPLVYDQRLNPSALFGHHDNGSRISMQDQQDYSRPLGVMNPDVRASFDSRMSRTG